MSKKPTRKATKKQARKPLLPLDHPTNWLPAVEMHNLLVQPSGGSRHLAAFDLNEALERGTVRCMRRHVRSGDREEVPLTFWHDFELSFWTDGAVIVMRRGRGGFAPFRGVVFFCWKPDVVKAWPGLLKEHVTPAGESEERRGRKRHASGPRLLSDQQVKDAQTYYDGLLNANEQKWRHQQTAAKHITVDYLKLPEESWQTVEDQVVVPKLIERGLKPRSRK